MIHNFNKFFLIKINVLIHSDQNINLFIQQYHPITIVIKSCYGTGKRLRWDFSGFNRNSVFLTFARTIFLFVFLSIIKDFFQKDMIFRLFFLGSITCLFAKDNSLQWVKQIHFFLVQKKELLKLSSQNYWFLWLLFEKL